MAHHKNIVANKGRESLAMDYHSTMTLEKTISAARDSMILTILLLVDLSLCLSRCFSN